MEAIILAAGEGTRMRPLTYTTPKSLLKIANEPILEHNLTQLKQSGIEDIIIVVGYLQDEIKDFLNNRKFDLNIKFVEQTEYLGTGHALLQTKEFVTEDRFLVLYGDDLYHHIDITKCLKNDLCVASKEVSEPERFGILELENGFVKNLIEKPSSTSSNLANTGLYILNKEIFNYLKKIKKSTRNEIELTDAILEMSKDFKIKCEIVDNWIPIGYPWDLLTANEIKLNEISESYIDDTSVIEEGVKINGFVKIGKNSKIKSGSYIEGPIIIGDNCTIGPNCYIRAYSTIANDCKIGNAVEIKNSIIGEKTKIEHLSYVGDSIIGNNCNLGAGTITANLRHDNKTIRMMVKGERIDTRKRKLGIVMGDYSKSGINTSFYPGVAIGPFSWTAPHVTIKENIEPLILFDGNSKKSLEINNFEKVIDDKDLKKINILSRK